MKSPASWRIEGNNFIKFCVYAYAIYALFLLLECIDFLSLLHTPDPGFHATYSVVHVAFFIIELIVYASVSLGLVILLNLDDKKPSTVILILIVITVFRMVMIYYLYWQTDPKVHFIPYIYKKSNDFSGIIRGTLLPIQIISGLFCIWKWIMISKHLKS